MSTKNKRPIPLSKQRKAALASVTIADIERAHRLRENPDEVFRRVGLPIPYPLPRYDRYQRWGRFFEQSVFVATTASEATEGIVSEILMLSFDDLLVDMLVEAYHVMWNDKPLPTSLYYAATVFLQEPGKYKSRRFARIFAPWVDGSWQEFLKEEEKGWWMLDNLLSVVTTKNKSYFFFKKDKYATVPILEKEFRGYRFTIHEYEGGYVDAMANKTFSSVVVDMGGNAVVGQQRFVRNDFLHLVQNHYRERKLQTLARALTG